MAIRFKYDATGVVIPRNKSQQKFGEQLVLNQQKYANDVRQNIYNQQKQGMQNQFQWNMAAGNNLERERQEKDRTAAQNTLDATKLADSRAFDATKLADQRTYAEKMAEAQRERERQAQLVTQARADDLDGIKSGAYDTDTAREIKDAYANKTRIDLNPDLDAGQKAQAHAENDAKLGVLRGKRTPVPSDEDRLNSNVKWKDPDGNYHDPMDRNKFPDGKKPQGWDSVDFNPQGGGTRGSAKQQPQQLPPSYEEYKDTNYERHQKALDAKVAEYRDKAEGPGGEKYAGWSDQQFEDAAYDELKGKYERDRGRSAAAKPPVAPAPGQAPQAGQVPGQPEVLADGTLAAADAAAMVPSQGSAMTPQVPGQPEVLADGTLAAGQVDAAPASYMQGLEPTYNPDGTSNAPQAGVGTAPGYQPPAAAPGSPAPAPPPVQGVQPLVPPEQAPQAAGQPVAAPAVKPGVVFEQDDLGNIMDARSINWSEQPVGTRMRKADGKTYLKTARFKWDPWEKGQPITPQQNGQPLAQPKGKAYGYFGKKDAAEQVAAQQAAVAQEAAYQAAFNPKAAPPQQAVPPVPPQQSAPPATAWLSQAASEAAAAAAVDSGQPVMETEPPAAAATTPPAAEPPVATETTPAPASTPNAATPAPTPDFGKLIASASGDAERTVVGKLQGMYKTAKPDIQKAIDVLVNAESDPNLIAQAYAYLESKGIPISQWAMTRERNPSGLSASKPIAPGF